MFLFYLEQTKTQIKHIFQVMCNHPVFCYRLKRWYMYIVNSLFIIFCNVTPSCYIIIVFLSIAANDSEIKQIQQILFTVIMLQIFSKESPLYNI